MKGNGNGNAAATLSEDLITRARAIANRSDELLQLLEDARQRLLDPSEQSASKRRFQPKPADQPNHRIAVGSGAETSRSATISSSVSWCGD